MTARPPALDARGCLEVAQRIGERLVSEALWDGGRCTWLGDDFRLVDGVWETVHASFGGDLYDGTSGVARFLAHLARVSDGSSLRRTAVGAARHALGEALDDGAGFASGGLCRGALGTTGVVAEVARLVGDEALGSEASALAERAATTLRVGEETDLMAGDAGTLLVLLGLWRTTEKDAWLARARETGEALLEAAHRSPAGWSWGGSAAASPGEPDLCGIAHGASGVALALLELHAATGEQAFRHGVEQAFVYERGWFDRGAFGWPDLREFRPDHLDAGDDAGEPPTPAFWCSGAAGVGLVRLRAFELLGDERAAVEAGAAIHVARREAARALARRGADPFARNASLCHGLGGSADLFAYAHQVFGGEEHLRAARRLGAALHSDAVARGGEWACGLHGAGETPGLMLGLAGIGACFLRLHDPRSLPPLGLLFVPADPGASAS